METAIIPSSASAPLGLTHHAGENGSVFTPVGSESVVRICGDTFVGSSQGLAPDFLGGRGEPLLSAGSSSTLRAEIISSNSSHSLQGLARAREESYLDTEAGLYDAEHEPLEEQEFAIVPRSQDDVPDNFLEDPHLPEYFTEATIRALKKGNNFENIIGTAFDSVYYGASEIAPNVSHMQTTPGRQSTPPPPPPDHIVDLIFNIQEHESKEVRLTKLIALFREHRSNKHLGWQKFLDYVIDFLIRSRDALCDLPRHEVGIGIAIIGFLLIRRWLTKIQIITIMSGKPNGATDEFGLLGTPKPRLRDRIMRNAKRVV
ncbi:hypothetical protein TWF281_004107 [Arthrobotrys megalospora]